MRILQIHPLMKSEALSPAAGGMARAALQLTRLLVERGHEVQVIPIPEGLGSRELWEVAPGRAVEVAAAMHFPSAKDAIWLTGSLLRLRPLPAGMRNVFYDAFALTALRSEVRLFRPDIIHNHLARRPFPRLARALGMRGNLLLTHHHGEPGEGLEIYDRIFFPSQSARDHVVSLVRYPEERTGYIHYPVSPVFCRTPIDPDRRREGVLFVGAVRRRKGIDLLLDAYRSDRSLWKDPLYIAGRGEDEELVRRAVEEGLPVRPLGQLSQPELAQTLLGVRLLAIPSRLEGFSIAVLEALCCGVPAVGWAPQIRELESVLGAQAGKPFDGRTQTAGELAGLMAEILRDGDSDPKRGLFLATASRDAFSEQRYVESYLALYRDMTAGGSTGPPA
jgi:glycosyltransferase involved in cell wall biosynthesis